MVDKNTVIIPESVHPSYLNLWIDWEKFRYIMEGGDDFIEKYLIKFSSREDDTDFANRKLITPIPGFASAALIDVKNAIFQRMDDISREGGSDLFDTVMAGGRGGVDQQESTMNHFIGKKVLPELLFMGKVGIYVDMPVLPELQTKFDANQVHPYYYTYRAEQIRNWIFEYPREGVEFEKLLLEENIIAYDNFGLPKEEKKRYRLLSKEDGVVLVRFYDSDNKQVNLDGEFTDTPIELKINHIPFVLLELDRSMLQDIANHQIALLNMESSDVNYSLKANFPFYTEQYSGKFGSSYLQGNEDSEDHRQGSEVEVGGVQGRRYGKDLDRPGFINPSPEPLEASMEKQKNLKDDIRALVNLALSAIRPKFASAESKVMDERGLEAGLSFLGLVLEQGERQLAKLFSEYEGDGKIATINYPERYNLKTDKQRLDEADALGGQMAIVPSQTYQKAIAKEITAILLDAKVSNDDLKKILDEIEVADFISSDAGDIHADIEKGLVSLETASKARGYDPDEVTKAAKDHAERIARIKEAQGNDNDAGARGIDDESDNPSSNAKAEKDSSQNPDIQDRGQKPVRGKGENVSDKKN